MSSGRQRGGRWQWLRRSSVLTIFAGISAGLLAPEHAASQEQPVYRFAVIGGAFTALRQGLDSQPCFSIDLGVAASNLDFLLYPTQPSVDRSWTPHIAGTCINNAIRPKIRMKGTYVPTFVLPGPDGEQPEDFIDLDTVLELERHNCHDIDNCFWEPINARIRFDGRVMGGTDIPEEARLYWHTTDNGGTWEGYMSLKLVYERYNP